MPAGKAKFAIGLIVVAAFVAAALLLLTRGPADDVGVVHKLPDGSALQLYSVVFTNRNYNFSYQSAGSKWQRFLTSILPQPVLKRLPFSRSSSSFGFGIQDDDTNLVVVTVNRNDAAPNWSSTLRRMVVFDEQGDSFDAAWGANTAIFNGETVHGWLARAFPRRSKTLGLRFLARTSDGSWTNAAEFEIRNPAYADYPQWTPEPWPVTKRDGDLAVTLSGFQSGGRMSGERHEGDEQTVTRMTRVVLTFTQDRRPAEIWRVQKLTLSDATGNHWFPYLDSVQDSNWTTTGIVDFLGALWPGETAWKLDVECVRTAGFSKDELWETPPIQLPPFGQLTEPTNRWQHDGTTVQLVALASPNTDHPGQFKWIAKWWGEDRSKVYSLALEISPELQGRRLTVIKAIDQDGRKVEIVQHGNQDQTEQAVFLKPQDDSAQVRITFALQRSRFVQFLARPEFVNTSVTNLPAKN